jgi:exoribonuclease-2
VLGGGELPRGAHVRVKLGEIDLIMLDVRGTVLERLDVAPEPLESEEDTEDEPVAGPIAIAVDVTESDEPAGADAPAAS